MTIDDEKHEIVHNQGALDGERGQAFLFGKRFAFSLHVDLMPVFNLGLMAIDVFKPYPTYPVSLDMPLSPAWEPGNFLVGPMTWIMVEPPKEALAPPMAYVWGNQS